jgi:hypothetical protein
VALFHHCRPIRLHCKSVMPIVLVRSKQILSEVAPHFLVALRMGLPFQESGELPMHRGRSETILSTLIKLEGQSSIEEDEQVRDFGISTELQCFLHVEETRQQPQPWMALMKVQCVTDLSQYVF